MLTMIRPARRTATLTVLMNDPRPIKPECRRMLAGLKVKLQRWPSHLLRSVWRPEAEEPVHSAARLAVFSEHEERQRLVANARAPSTKLNQDIIERIAGMLQPLATSRYIHVAILGSVN